MKKSMFVLRTICLVLSVVLVLSLITGCAENPDDNSMYSTIVEWVEEEVQDDSGNKNTNTDSNSQSTGNDSQNQVSNSNSNVEGTIDKNTDIEKYRGTEIVYAKWADSDGVDTDGIIATFKKKYGIKVTVRTVAQTNYVQTISGQIASGKAPDIIKDADSFPSSISIAMPLSEAGIDTNSSLWDQGIIKNSTVNGKSYFLNSVGGLFSNNTCMYYNKKLLTSNGIKTPEDYKKINKWNTEAVYAIMKASANIGKSYYGICGTDHLFRGAYSYGLSLFQVNNGKIETNITNPNFISYAQMISKWNDEGLVQLGRDAFINGKCALIISDSFGCMKNGYFSSMNKNDIGVIEMPEFNGIAPKDTRKWNAYGICKGAKNPMAAGIFLSYYLDSNNYNFSNQVINDEAMKYLLDHTTHSTNTPINVDGGVTKLTGITVAEYYGKLYTAKPEQIQSICSSLTNEINSLVTNCNDFITKNQ